MKRYFVTGQGTEKGVEKVSSSDTFVVDSTIATALVVALTAGFTSVWDALYQAKSVAGMVAGTGITTGSGTVAKAGVEKVGDIFITRILMGLDGLRSTIDGDIIGVDGTALKCHWGQITTAVNGTIFAGQAIPFETPAGGDPDINIFSATEDTGSEDDAISGLTSTALLDYAGDFAPETPKILTALPAADEFIYLVAGATTDADYTGGIILLELYGT